MLSLLLLGCCGCTVVPVGPRRALKESYVEPIRSEESVVLKPYPLNPDDEERAFAAIRSFSKNLGEGTEKLGRLLGQFGGSKKKEGETLGDGEEAFELDTSEIGEKGLPSLLVYPESVSIRGDGACYLGQSSYTQVAYAPGIKIIQHLRLLVVNRESSPVKVPMDDFILLIPDIEEEAEEGGGGIRLSFLVAANVRGEKIKELEIPPKEERLAHVFFGAPKIARSVKAVWKVKGEGKAEWNFEVTLLRRYVINNGLISALEQRVALGDELPEVSERPSDWTEPRISPVPAGN